MDKIIIWLTPVVLIFYIAFIVDYSITPNIGFEECMKAFNNDKKCFDTYYTEFKG